jgi:kinesin family member 18/19
MKTLSQNYSKPIIGNIRLKNICYAFDHILNEQCTQEDVSPFKWNNIKVFAHTAKPLLDEVLDGFNATIFAFGASGCGKTHTILYTQLAGPQSKW